MKPKREEPIIHATLEVLDDEDVQRPPLRLTPEQIAELEAEKQSLAAQLRTRVAEAREDSGVLGDVEDDGTFEHLDPRARRAGARRTQPVESASGALVPEPV